MKHTDNELTPFQKGIDFVQYFTGKRFTLDDIKNRYHCTYRQAMNIRNQVDALLHVSPAGISSQGGARGPLKSLWEIRPI